MHLSASAVIFSTKDKAKTSGVETEAEAVKIPLLGCLEIGSALRHHITGFTVSFIDFIVFTVHCQIIRQLFMSVTDVIVFHEICDCMYLSDDQSVEETVEFSTIP